MGFWADMKDGKIREQIPFPERAREIMSRMAEVADFGTCRIELQRR